MKPIVLVSVCVVAVLCALTNAQVPVGPVAGVAAPIIPPVMPPMLGAMPFPFLGMGMGLGLGLGLPFLGPFGGILAMRRLALLGLMGRKKRDVTDVDEEKIKCTISTKNGGLVCLIGESQKIGCEVEPRLGGVRDIKLRLIDLHLNGTQSQLGLYSSKSLASGSSKPYTYIDPVSREPVVLSINSNPESTEPGFWVSNSVCYKAIWDVIEPQLERVKFDLIVA